MFDLPGFLRPFEEKAAAALKKQSILDIEFSGSTYQIQVQDPDTSLSYWTFIQLDRFSRLKDHFCECDISEEGESACVHQAIAYLKIFQGGDPLHERFQDSFWNAYFYELSKDDPKPFSFNKKSASCELTTKETHLLLKAKTKEAKEILFRLFEEEERETEGTSIKFSGLPEEEILLWRQGRATPHLSYTLSRFYDLAKWLFFLQEDSLKAATFSLISGLPRKIEVEFKEAIFRSEVSEARLSVLIPSLRFLNPPFKIHDFFQGNLEKAIFDPIDKTLKLIWQKESKGLSQKEKGVDFLGWTFIQNDGFYPKELKEGVLSSQLKGDQIGDSFERFPFIRKVLEGVNFHEEPQMLSYSLFFDSGWNLHVCPYLFEEGDLSRPEAALFGHYAYLPEEGFFRLVEVSFSEKEVVIPPEKVPEFIQNERKILMEEEGFLVHVAPLEYQLDYDLDSQGRLHFFENMQTLVEDAHEFGPWIYIPEEGFYQAAHSRSFEGKVRPGMIFTQEQIPLLIESHEEELKQIPGFFASRCPIEKARLIISLTEEETIECQPIYHLTEGVFLEDIQWFDTVVYTQNEGFFKLPATRMLPFGFREKKIIEGQELILFLLHILPDLNPFIEVLDPRLEKPEELFLTIEEIHPLDNPGLFDVSLTYRNRLGEVNATHLVNILQQKKRFFFSVIGLFDLYAGRFSWIRGLLNAPKSEKTIILSSLDFYRLLSIEEVTFKGDDKASEEIWKGLISFSPPKEPDLKHLVGSLRPYQMAGVKWLWFLWTYRLSGLLCDDMGLGKTHQAMALIAAMMAGQKEKLPPILIVCPTSVLFHWQEKLQEFLPKAHVLTYYGLYRNLDLFRHRYDVLLTSYGMLRIENASLSQIPFSLAIFDEIQVAKNHQSRLYSALLNIKRAMCLGLTGTPIENRLRELKALFDIVLPSYMPGEKPFRELFIKPIEKERSQPHHLKLSKLIHPFILRRRKQEVLTELPEKIEEVVHCFLEEDQKKLYNEVLSREKPLLEEALQTEQISYVHIFACLSKLKQICNHPAAYLKTPKNYKNFVSGKWDLFLELLNEAKGSGQKVVVFTHYLAMLDIFKLYLEEQGIGYALLQGSTVNRGEEVKRFQENPSCEVFLGSLQAAGFGIDLTAASVVIHYDRWWNPARENQATDRVHRMGQTRGVQVFKFVTKGTIEDRIDQLIEQKARLMADIIGLDDQSLIKRLTKEELFQLLT